MLVILTNLQGQIKEMTAEELLPRLGFVAHDGDLLTDDPV
jgi:hypothetical protein